MKKKGDNGENSLFFIPLKEVALDNLAEIIKQPLKWPEAVCRCFCTQCYASGEINLQYAEKLVSVMRILGNLPETPLHKPEHFKKYYFETNCCENCKRQEAISVILKEIL